MSPHRPARRDLRLVTLLAALLGLLAGGLTERAAAAELTDRVVSVVGDDVVITLSELAVEEALRDMARSPVPPFRDEARDTLTLVEDVRILRALAGDIRIFQPDDRQVSDRMDALREGAGDVGLWRRFLEDSGLTEADVERLVRGWLVAEITVRRNVGLNVLDAHPEPGPAQDAAYGAAYDSWMSERRAQFPVRRVDEQEVR